MRSAVLLLVVAGLITPMVQRQPQMTTLAYRVHKMDAMLAFYSEAFGATFAPEQLGPLVIRVGQVGGVLVKFVPIRDASDFTGFPVHQPGYQVDDVQRVIAIALKHGGTVQDAPVTREGRMHAAVRDPDGNTIELYGPAR